MAIRELIPWGRGAGRSTVPGTRRDEGNPFLSLHREMNRLFDEAFSRFDMPAMFGRGSAAAWPSIEVVSSDNDVRVSAELPGLDEKDIEVLVEGDTLTIRGEKKAEMEDRDRGFSERTYGHFQRTIQLPFEVQQEMIEASFRNGVLTVLLPKSPDAQAKVKRIAINASTKH